MARFGSATQKQKVLTSRRGSIVGLVKPETTSPKASGENKPLDFVTEEKEEA